MKSLEVEAREGLSKVRMARVREYIATKRWEVERAEEKYRRLKREYDVLLEQELGDVFLELVGATHVLAPYPLMANYAI